MCVVPGKLVGPRSESTVPRLTMTVTKTMTKCADSDTDLENMNNTTQLDLTVYQAPTMAVSCFAFSLALGAICSLGGKSQK